MRNRITLLVALLCATSAFVVAGCGDDEEPSTTLSVETTSETTTGDVALSEEDFVNQANAVCAAGNEEIDQIANETFSGQQPTAAQIEEFAGVLVGSIQGQIDAIRALTPPEELAADVDTFLSDAEEVLGEVEADPSLLAASESDDPFAAVNVQAESLGLTECAG